MDMNISVHSGLDRFIMLDRITGIDETRIRGEKTVSPKETRCFSGIEILAQAGALHVRHTLDFKKHAFLLGISSYEGPRRVEPGLFRLCGVCESQSQNAFAYRLDMENDTGSKISGRFLFAVTDYGPDFKKDDLEQHYRNLFSCLTTGTEKNSIISA